MLGSGDESGLDEAAMTQQHVRHLNHRRRMNAASMPGSGVVLQSCQSQGLCWSHVRVRLRGCAAAYIVISRSEGSHAELQSGLAPFTRILQATLNLQLAHRVHMHVVRLGPLYMHLAVNTKPSTGTQSPREDT